MTDARGFTVVEMLVAMAILAIVSTAIVGALPTINTTNRAAVDSLDTTVVAKSYFEVVATTWGTRLAFDAATLPAAPTTPRRTCSATASNPDGAVTPAVRRLVELRCTGPGATAQVFWIEIGRPPS